MKTKSIKSNLYFSNKFNSQNILYKLIALLLFVHISNSVKAQNNLIDQLDIGTVTVTASASSVSTVVGIWDNNNADSSLLNTAPPVAQWATTWASAPANATWVIADFGIAGRAIRGFSLAAPTDITQSPIKFRIQASNDSVSWTDLFNAAGIPGTVAAWKSFGREGQTRMGNFANNTAYRYYKLIIDGIQSGATFGTVAISELQLFENIGISGYVFKDNGDKLYGKGAGDLGIQGDTVSLVNEAGKVFAIAVTDANGLYSFPADTLSYTSATLGNRYGLDGDFSVVVKPPHGYTFVSELSQPYTQYTVSRFSANTATGGELAYSNMAPDGVFAFLSLRSIINVPAVSGPIIPVVFPLVPLPPVTLIPANPNPLYNNRSRWDFGRNIIRPGSNGYTLNVNLNQQSLDFGLQSTISYDITASYPSGFSAVGTNLITTEQNGTFNQVPDSSYTINHPTIPSFFITPDTSYNNNTIYNPTAIAATSAYIYDASAGAVPGIILPGIASSYSGSLDYDGYYNITGYLGTIQSDVVGSATTDMGPMRVNASFINTYGGGWRKTYGATTGDVYDKFMTVNGSTNGALLFQSNTFTITAGKTYAVMLSGKGANASIQIGTYSPVSLNVSVKGLNMMSQPVTAGSGTITFTAPANNPLQDNPNSAWDNESVIFTATSSGTFSLGISAATTGSDGNDFYIDNISVYELASNISISGNVFNDTDGSKDNTVDGNGIGSASGNQLYVNLLNASGNVVATAAVNNNGTYTFPSAYLNYNFTIQLSTNQGIVGSAAPVTNLSAGWINTGENLGATSGNDGNVDGNLEINTGTTNITNANFAIERLPESAISIQVNQTNPNTGTNYFTIPAAAFINSTNPTDSSTKDYDGGIVDSIRITAFPTNAVSLIVGTTTYYSTMANLPVGCSSCAVFPNGGIRIHYVAGTGLDSIIKIAPAPNAGHSKIYFAAIDNAGKEDPTPGNLTMPFISITLFIWGDFTARAAANDVLLQWHINDETNMMGYEIEYSMDGNSFTGIGYTTASGNQNYGFKQLNPVVGVNYYRLKMVGKNGLITYSTVEKINLAGDNLKVSIYPNPSKNNFNIQLPNTMVSKAIEVRIISVDGRTLLQKNVAKAQQIEKINIGNIASGKYLVQLVSKDTVLMGSVVIEK